MFNCMCSVLAIKYVSKCSLFGFDVYFNKTSVRTDLKIDWFVIDMNNPVPRVNAV